MMKKSISLVMLTAAMLSLTGCKFTMSLEKTGAETAASTAGTEAAAETAAAASGQTTTAAVTSAAAEKAATSAATTAVAATTAAATSAAATSATAAATSAAATAAVTTAAPAPAADTEWKSIYKEVLLRYKASVDNPEDARWDLQDLDQDGIPELLLTDGTYHAAGVGIYYYENRTAVEMENADGSPLRYGGYGEMLICPAEHLIGNADMHMGYSYAAIDRYENHKLTALLRLNEDSGAVGAENVTYLDQNVKVTKEEYDKKLAEFNAKKWVSAGAQYPLDDLSALN